MAEPDQPPPRPKSPGAPFARYWQGTLYGGLTVKAQSGRRAYRCVRLNHGAERLEKQVGRSVGLCRNVKVGGRYSAAILRNVCGAGWYAASCAM
jgi:hypothetical protein